MNRLKKILILTAIVPVLSSCVQKYVVFDNPYAYVVLEGDLQYGESSVVPSNVNNVIRTYNVYLSSKSFDSAITVNYDIVAGDGLKEGVDFETVSSDRTLTFLPGIYCMPVRIKYLRHELDSSKDNTLMISLSSSSDPAVSLGFPGDARKCSKHIITKFNI